MLNSIVKNAFFFLMAAIVMAILYFILFGWGHDAFMGGNGAVNDGVWSTNGASFKGALYVAAEAVEGSIARYYYEYCFLPTVHATDGLDKLLGATVFMDYQNTNPNLSNSNTDHVTVNNVTGKSWSTGWK